MKHKHYMKPTIKLVQLRQQRHILAGSAPKQVSARMTHTWEEESLDE